MKLTDTRVVYRGFHGKGHDHTVTRLGVSTYTDSASVAAVYATNPSHKDDKAENPMITVAWLRPKKPYQLGCDEEDVVSWQQLRETLDLTEAERETLLDLPWRDNGEWTAVPHGAWPNPEVYTDSYRVADSPAFIEMLRQRGYDSFCMRGTFTSDDLMKPFEKLPSGSHRESDSSVAEWHVLKPEVLTERGTLPVNDEFLHHLSELPGEELGAVLIETVRIRDLDIPDIEEDLGSDLLDQYRYTRRLTPADLENARDRAGLTLRESFKSATKESRAMVRDYAKGKLDKEIIVLDGVVIQEGFHRAMAALKSNQTIKAIDLSDPPAPPPPPEQALVVVHPGPDLSNANDAGKAERKIATTARRILRWMEHHPTAHVSVIDAPTAGAYAPETAHLFALIRKRADLTVDGQSSPVQAAAAVRMAHTGPRLLAGFFRDRCIKDLALHLPGVVSPDLSMKEPSNIWRP
jgi:hypothetical protein